MQRIAVHAGPAPGVGVGAALGVGSAVGVEGAALPALDCVAGLEGWVAALAGWLPAAPPDWLPGCGRACSAATPQDASPAISSAAAAA